MTQEKAKVLLIVLDGFGLLALEEGNAFFQAKTPFFEGLIASSPSTALHAASTEVGLSWGEVGNSEVGHFNLGLGQVVWQDLPTINQAIESGEFKKNPVLLSAARNAARKGSALHLIGLISNGGVHAHIDHLLALLEFAKKQGVKEVLIHGITDGRDTGPKDGHQFVEKIEQKTESLALGKIATLSGRFYAMDRDNHWDRIAVVYLALTAGRGERADSASGALDLAYRRGESDEFLKPTLIKPNFRPIAKSDSVVFFNYRADRARQLTRAFLAKDFNDFNRQDDLSDKIFFATMTPYESDWKVKVNIVFPPKKIEPPLARVLSQHRIAQYHVAETEKYAHVTYFFNGGEEKQFPLEDRELIRSPNVKTYDLKPEMSALGVSRKLTAALKAGRYGFLLANFANPDMVGHTGVLEKAALGLEAVDGALAVVVKAASEGGYTTLITADHGNCEQMINPETREIDKEHTVNPVPLIAVPPNSLKDGQALSADLKLSLSSIQPVGVLADVGPTILDFLGLKKPPEMTGYSLRTTLGL